MGILISRFRKKKNTLEKLEEIEQKIKNIEKFHKETEQKFRRVIGKLIVTSIIIYILALCGYYYYFSPDTFRENILKFMPLLVFPIMIFLSRKLLSWYYRRKLSRNEATLKTLKTDKKKILDDVMEKETYKVAKEILEKFAPDQLNKDANKNQSAPSNSTKIIVPSVPARDNSVARHRMISNTPGYQKLALSSLPDVASDTLLSKSSRVQPRLSLPKPVLPRERGAFDKLVDMIIGDGPNNRYALICKVCSAHNGMALKHEFEYLAFRCAYCFQWNAARKQKPLAPNLISDASLPDESDANNSEAELPERSSNVSESQLKITEITDNSDDTSNIAVSESPLAVEDISKSVNETETDSKVSASTDSMDLSELKEALPDVKNVDVNSAQPVPDSSSVMDVDSDQNDVSKKR